jgi:UDP-2-acetamido-3-amino-2,3-dideoxy-glucuronate N-acetyltransferase
MSADSFVHATAEIADGATLGEGVQVWHHCQVREGARLGDFCILGKGVYIDSGVQIGSQVKIQNYVSVYQGVTIENGVFIGPHVCFTNDLQPRAINPDGTPKKADEWMLSPTLIQHGASIGANATIRCGVVVGKWAMIGAGSVITHSVPDYGRVYGNPARLHGFICPCGGKLEIKDSPLSDSESDHALLIHGRCQSCDRVVELRDWRKSEPDWPLSDAEGGQE